MMWQFYLLAVVQSLWLNLSYSSAANKLPLSSSLLTDEGLEMIMKSKDYDFDSVNLENLKQGFHKRGGSIDASSLVTDFWDVISNSDSFTKSSEIALKSVLAELQSIDSLLFNTSPMSLPILKTHWVANSSKDNKCVEVSSADGTLELCIPLLDCSGLSLDELISEYSPPTSLFLELKDLSVTCSADWTLTYMASHATAQPPHPLEYQGTAGFSLAGLSSSALLTLVPGASTAMKDILIPVALDLQDCAVGEGVTVDVFFSGGVIGAVLDRILAPLLGDAVETSLPWLLCDVFGPVLERAVTRLLTSTVDPALDALMAQSSPPPPVLIPDRLSWSSSLLQSVHQAVDAVRANEAKLLKCVIQTDWEKVSEGSVQEVGEAPLKQLLIRLEELLLSAIRDVGSMTQHLSGAVGSGVEVLSVSMQGLHTLSDLQLLYPSAFSNVTLNSTLSFSRLDVEVTLAVTQGGERQVVQAVVQMKDLALQLGVVVGLSSEELQGLYVDQASFPCVLSTLRELFVSSLVVDVSVDSLVLAVGDPSVSSGGIDLVNDVLLLLVDGYPAMTSQLIAGLFQGPVRNSINEKLTAARGNCSEQHPSAVQCGPHVGRNESMAQWIEWTNSTVMQGIDHLFSEVIGPSGMNSLVDCLTEGSNSLLINIPQDFPVFAGWELTLSGLNSFYEFWLFSPAADDPYDLLADLAVGGDCPLTTLAESEAGSTKCTPLNVTLTGYQNNGVHVDVRLKVKNMRLFLDMLLGVDTVSLSNMRLFDLLRTQGCAANAIDAFKVADWSLHTDSVEFFFVEQTEEISLTDLANKVFGGLLSPDNQEAFNAALSDALGNARAVCADGGVAPASDSSDDPGEEQSQQARSLLHFFRHTWHWKVAVLVAGTLLSFGLLLRVYYHKGTQLGASTISTPDKASASSLSESNAFSNVWIQHQLRRCVPSTYRGESGRGEAAVPYDSLLGNETLPLSTRLTVVVLIAVIVFTFVVSEIPSSPAALVIMEIDMGLQTSPAITVFKFGLGETVREMWEAEVYYLAALIAFFTGGWPYIKMVAMLLCWALPSSVLTVPWRESLLVWLDLLGKWSLVDSFVMMVMMVGFNFSFDIAPGVTVRVTVSPQWGFYAFLLATAASLAIGHFVLACHRLCCAVDERKKDCGGGLGKADIESKSKASEHLKDVGCSADDNQCSCAEEGVPSKEALMDHVFVIQATDIPPAAAAELTVSLVHAAEEDGKGGATGRYDLVVSLTRTGKLLVIAVFAASTAAVFFGAFIPVIEFDFIGLTGYLMEQPVTSYSLMDIGLKIPAASGDPHSFGVLFIQIIYVMFGIVMPLCFFTLLGGLFVLPFSLPTFRGVVMLTEVMNAWAALDVLVVSVVASVMEIRRFAQFMIGGSCGEMNEILEAHMDEELDGYDTCFDVLASMKQTSALAYLAAFLLIAVGLLMRLLANRALEERGATHEPKAKRHPSKGRLLAGLHCLQFCGVVSVRRA